MLSAKILQTTSWKNSLNDVEKDYVRKVLEKLPEDSRIIIYLHYWRDIELSDIAKTLGVRLREIQFVHDATLRLLSKVFSQKLDEQQLKPKGTAA